jgi:hypothetical protein
MKDEQSPAVIADNSEDEQQQEKTAGLEIKEKADREKINGT